MALAAALTLVCCSSGTRGGNAGGGGEQDPLDTGTPDGGREDTGPKDTGKQPYRNEGGIVLPNCLDEDGDQYGVGDGCLGPDFDDTDYRVYPGAPERCDGKDNDDNGLVDAEDEERFVPEPCARSQGVCRGTHAECVDGVSQLPCDRAVYGPDFLEDEDLVCDGRDNDCDGQADEGCDGIDTAEQICPDDACAERTCELGAWLPCVNFRSPEAETCDGIDNDCDGDVDERDGLGLSLCGRCPFEMMAVDTVNLDLCIDRWEASRSDATSGQPGIDDAGPATSRPGVLPWVAISRSEAVTACRAAGKDLCTAAQWQHACQYIGYIEIDGGNPDWVYPYGESYVPDRCNGADAGNGRVLPTGTMEECKVDVDRAAMDLSGNVREWIDEKIAGERAAYGGSFQSAGEALRCDVYDSLDSRTEDLGTGFRCCKPLLNN